MEVGVRQKRGFVNRFVLKTGEIFLVSDPGKELAAEVNATIVKRILPLLRSFTSEVLVFTGGVAHNRSVGKLLEAGSGKKVVVPKEPQFNGAIGCCVEGSRDT